MRLRTKLLLASAVVTSGAFAWWHYATAPPPPRVYRIGFQNSPPRQMVSPAGEPYGPTIDVLRVAAEHAGIQLRWIQVPEGPDFAFDHGKVDLWPLVARTPERLRSY